MEVAKLPGAVRVYVDQNADVISGPVRTKMFWSD